MHKEFMQIKKKSKINNIEAKHLQYNKNYKLKKG